MWTKSFHPFADTFLLGLRAALWAFHKVDSGRFWDDRDLFIITRWTKSFHPFADTFLLGLWLLSGHFIKVKLFHPFVDSFLLGPRVALWAFLVVDTFLLGPWFAGHIY